MRGSVWVLLLCYLTNRRGTVYAKQKIYGFSEVRNVNTVEQQKIQYNKALNKALAVYRAQNNLDSDTEVGYSHLNDGITYEGRSEGKIVKKRIPTKLTAGDKRAVRREVLRTQALKGESGKTITSTEVKRMYDKKITQKEYEQKRKLQSRK